MHFFKASLQSKTFAKYLKFKFNSINFMTFEIMTEKSKKLMMIRTLNQKKF